MSLGVVPFLALRYLGAKRRAGRAAPALLSLLGVGVGVMTLTVVLGVMNGFQLGFIESIVEISSYHLQIHTPQGQALSPEILASVRALPSVTALVPFSEEQGLVEGTFRRPRACTVRAVPPDLLTLDPAQKGKLALQEGAFSIADDRSIVVGAELASLLGARPGDEISFISVGSSDGRLTAVRTGLTVRGTFRSGYYDFDSGLAFVSLAAAARISGARPSLAYGVKLHNRFADGDALQRISALAGAGARVESWRAYNRSFFDALFVEKLMMMVLIGLIFVVVGFNIYHSLRRSIHEKMEEIAVLKALGVPPRSLQYAFICEGLAIGVIGAFGGMVLGLLLAVNVNGMFSLVETAVNAAAWLARVIASPLLPAGSPQSFAIFSPLYFYLTEVPSRVLLPEAGAIASFAVAACIAASYGASRVVTGFRPAEVLRYE